MIGSVPAVSVLRAAFTKEAIDTDPANAGLTIADSTAHTIDRGRSGRCRDRCRRRWAGRRSRGRVTVPVCLRVVHAFADSDSSEAVLVDVVEHVVSQVQGCKLVDIMRDAEVVAEIDALLEVVLCSLDLLLGKLIVIVCVQVKACNTKSRQHIPCSSLHYVPYNTNGD